MGHSLGGVVAAGIAATDPDLVDRLILVDAAFLSFEPGTVKHLRSLVREGLQLPAGLLPRALQDFVRAGPTSFASGTYELVFHDWRYLLPGVKQPTMIVWGEKDQLVPFSVGRVAPARDSGLGPRGHTRGWACPDVVGSGPIQSAGFGVPE